MQCKHERAHAYAVALRQTLRDEALRDAGRRSEPSKAEQMADSGELRGNLDHGIGRYLVRWPNCPGKAVESPIPPGF